jgi:hypothetical protein
MRLRRRSKKSRALGAIGDYLKFKAIAKAVKGVRKGVADAPKPVKALPVVAGVGAASAVAARKRRQSEPTSA